MSRKVGIWPTKWAFEAGHSLGLTYPRGLDQVLTHVLSVNRPRRARRLPYEGSSYEVVRSPSTFQGENGQHPGFSREMAVAGGAQQVRQSTFGGDGSS
jgi:hypothetical protein